jgi:hypothetical protein
VGGARRHQPRRRGESMAKGKLPGMALYHLSGYPERSQQDQPRRRRPSPVSSPCSLPSAPTQAVDQILNQGCTGTNWRQTGVSTLISLPVFESRPVVPSILKTTTLFDSWFAASK